MNYRVHSLEITTETAKDKLEQFLNGLEGEVVSIIPNLKKNSLFQIYGIKARVDFLLIVEKMK